MASFPTQTNTLLINQRHVLGLSSTVQSLHKQSRVNKNHKKWKAVEYVLDNHKKRQAEEHWIRLTTEQSQTHMIPDVTYRSGGWWCSHALLGSRCTTSSCSSSLLAPCCCRTPHPAGTISTCGRGSGLGLRLGWEVHLGLLHGLHHCILGGGLEGEVYYVSAQITQLVFVMLPELTEFMHICLSVVWVWSVTYLN